MNLNFQSYPEDYDPSTPNAEFGAAIPIIIIPGLFGSNVNWRSFAKQLAQTRPVVVIDQRNHGRSPHRATHSYDDMVADLYDFLGQLGIERVVLAGHSMGGKVAMIFALQHPELVDQLIVLDIAPVDYEHSHAPFLEELMQVSLETLESRKEADRELQGAIEDTATRMFLLQSLGGSPGEYHWRINLPVLHQYMSEITGFPREVLDGANNSQVDTVFVYGEQSDYVLIKHHATILSLFPAAKFIGIPKAGHWLHAEQPQLVLEAIKNFIK